MHFIQICFLCQGSHASEGLEHSRLGVCLFVYSF